MPEDHTVEMSVPDLSQDGMGEWSTLPGREWNVEAGAEGRGVQAAGHSQEGVRGD